MTAEGPGHAQAGKPPAAAEGPLKVVDSIDELPQPRKVALVEIHDQPRQVG
jgi:hypothetical protein